MTTDYVLAVDQGTSATKCVLLDRAGKVVRSASAPVRISYPGPGLVEQDIEDVLASVVSSVRSVLDGLGSRALIGVGLSTQRESALLWDRTTGKPLDALLGWQDRRASAVCERLRPYRDEIRRISGLPLDPMFSAAKLTWLLDRHDPDRRLSRSGRLAVGTVDSWLMFSLTGQHVIEVGNASRTQLLDLATGRWSRDLLEIFGVPERVLPAIISSEGALGRVTEGALAGVPVRAVLGDSHAALYAHTGPSGSYSGRGGFGGEAAKVTYGTGSSVMRLASGERGVGAEGSGAVCRTIAWADPEPVVAWEGNIRSSGATLVWLAELFGTTPDRIAGLAAGSSSDGVHIVPAFGGLAAPWWDDEARGLISGVTLGTRLPQLARAALESVVLQVDAVVRAMPGTDAILADGGASASDGLMRLQADVSGVPVHRARERDLSAIGAGLLAARSVWGDVRPLHYDVFDPQEDGSALRQAWLGAVRRSRKDD